MIAWSWNAVTIDVCERCVLRKAVLSVLAENGDFHTTSAAEGGARHARGGSSAVRTLRAQASIPQVSSSCAHAAKELVKKRRVLRARRSA